MDLTTTLILVAIFIGIEAFFSGCEIGLISVNRFKMQQLAQEGQSGAIQVKEMLGHPERFLSTTSLGTNIAVVSSTAVFTAYCVERFGEWGDFASMLIISPAILFFGEIIPKIVFQARADTLIPIMVHPLTWMSRIFGPVTGLFSRIYHSLFGWIFKTKGGVRKALVSREQLLNVVHPESEHAELDMAEKQMIHRIFQLGDITVDQCMVPLVQIVGIHDGATLADANHIASESGFSRLPVFHDRMFNLIGILNTFDLLNVPKDDSPITELIRPAYYIPPNKKVDDLLKELQQRGLHMAFVVDEYGGCIGVVTVEDLLEEIVGDIEDEFDEPEGQIQDYSDGGYIIAGETEIEMVNEQLGLRLPEGDYETIGGLMIDQFEKIPVPGDQINIGNARLTVREASKRRITTVILRIIEEEDGVEGDLEEPPSAENQSS